MLSMLRVILDLFWLKR